MANPPHPAAPESTFWRSPPLWLRVIGIPLVLLPVIGMIDARGIAMGILAGVVYGTLAIGLLAWERLVAWSQAHPLLDNLFIVPLLFCALAYLTSLSLPICAAITVAAAVPLVAIGAFRRHRTRA